MTYPDDVLKAAREAAIKVCHDAHKGDVYYDPRRYEARFRSGDCDDDYIVQSACIAIMAERQRCAGEIRKQIAGLRAQTEALDISRDVSALKIALSAILGQQEKEP